MPPSFQTSSDPNGTRRGDYKEHKEHMADCINEYIFSENLENSHIIEPVGGGGSSIHNDSAGYEYAQFDYYNDTNMVTD